MARPWNDWVSKSIGSLIICVFRKYVDWMAANVEIRVMERALVYLPGICLISRETGSECTNFSRYVLIGNVDVWTAHVADVKN